MKHEDQENVILWSNMIKFYVFSLLCHNRLIQKMLTFIYGESIFLKIWKIKIQSNPLNL